MKVKMKCTGRAENDNPIPTVDGLWTYAFSGVVESGQMKGAQIIFKINSSKVLHCKRGEFYDLDFNPHSSINIVNKMPDNLN